MAGVCDATPLNEKFYKNVSFSPFTRKNIRQRTDPETALKGARALIVVGVPWLESAICSDSTPDETASLGVLSSLGALADYHPRVVFVLRELVDKLGGGFRHKILVDSGGLDERAFAVRAGLGVYGRHGLVISPTWGTRFNIGLLVVDAECETSPAQAFDPGCADCGRCIKACPTGALAFTHTRVYTVERCISYLTQKEGLSPEEAAMLGNQLYGCDLCQDACPYNARLRGAPRGKTYVNPARWLAMTDEDFARVYGHTGMLWRGAEVLRRNARAVLQNLNGL